MKGDKSRKAFDFAQALIDIFKDTDEGITPLKLQKLLYYVQGISYQRYGKPAFNDEIEAWVDGPVVNDVYQHYRSCGRDPIRFAVDYHLTENEKRIVLDVAREYGKYTTNTLVGMTHKAGTPWKQVYENGAMHKIIPREVIADYFRSVEQHIPEIEMSELFSAADYTVVNKDTIIPLSVWNYE